MSLHMALYLPKELKTYSIKLSEYVLSTIDSANFNFSDLNYFNITKNIMKGLIEDKGPSFLTFLFENISDIPDEVLKAVKINKQLLEKKDTLIEEFKQFRMEKVIIKSIKYKTDIIRVN